MVSSQVPTHEAIAKRLARVAGHANSLPRLWAEQRESDDILTQIAAVRAALDQAGKLILLAHIESVVQEAIDRGKADEVIRHLADTLDRFVT